MINLAIRDDDVSYFTRPEDLERIYADIWDQVPVSLSVIPFVKPQVALAPKDQEGGDRLFPLGDNVELVAFLKEKMAEGKIYIMQHGYSHADTCGGYECDRGKNLIENIQKGKTYLEELFDCSVDVFVPPHNSILSYEALCALEEAGLDLLISYKRFPRSFHWLRPADYLGALRLLGFHLRRGWGMIYPHSNRCGHHQQVYCYTLNNAAQSERLQQAYRKLVFFSETSFCIATHHRTIDDNAVKALYEIVNDMSRDNEVCGVPAWALFNRVDTGSPSSKVLQGEFFQNEKYYELMLDWHEQHGGLALEEQVLIYCHEILSALPEKSTVLDIGCGPGAITAWLAERYPACSFVGTDISSVAIDMAGEKYGSRNNPRFCLDDINRSQCEDGSIECVIAISVLEHVVDYKKVLAECYRILRPGGVVLLRLANGGRVHKKFLGIIGDCMRYVFRSHTASCVKPSFDLSGASDNERIAKHKHNFDLWNIPSDILVQDLQEAGFSIQRFSTNKQSLFSKEIYQKSNWVVRGLVKLFVNVNMFPFDHMGCTSIIVGKK